MGTCVGRVCQDRSRTGAVNGGPLAEPGPAPDWTTAGRPFTIEQRQRRERDPGTDADPQQTRTVIETPASMWRCLDLDNSSAESMGHRAVTVEELDALVADLPAVGIAPPAPASAPLPAHRRDHQLFFALMSETVRRAAGPARAPPPSPSGDITLDFRDTPAPASPRSPPSDLGRDRIIVLPGVVVSQTASPSWAPSTTTRTRPPPTPDALILRIRGIVHGRRRGPRPTSARVLATPAGA